MRPIAARPETVEATPKPPLAPVRESTAAAEVPEPAGWLSAHRVISLVAVLGLLWPEFKAWKDIVSAPLPGLTTIALTGATLVVACLISAARSEDTLERLDRWLLVLGLLVLAAWTGWGLRTSSGYSTDEAAFVHAAAALLLQGHDPYGVNLIHSLATFGVPPIYWTYTMNGGAVSTLGYPALPMLVVAPFVALVGNAAAVAFAEIFALLIATWVAFASLPRTWRPLAIVLCVGFPSLEGFAVAGLNVVLMLPALIIVARQWTRVGENGRLSRGDRIAAGALGLALSTNQLAWTTAPFILVGIVLMRKRRYGTGRAVALTSRFGAVAAITFSVLNGPFIAWGPVAWWQGVTAPLNQHALPYGQGLVGLSALLRIGGGAVDLFTYASAGLYLGLLVLFAANFRALARCCFLLPVLALFASGRSLSEYWLALLAPIVICAAAADGTGLRSACELTWPESRRVRIPAKAASLLLFAPAVALIAAALLVPAPLAVRIVKVQLNQQDTAVVGVLATVRNRSDGPLRPHFAINSTGQASPFWRVLAGPRVLAAGAQASYMLKASEVDTTSAGPFLLQAVTDSPQTISSSTLFRPRLTFQGE